MSAVASAFRRFDGVDPPALVCLAWCLRAPMLVASTAPVGGGIGRRDWVLNVQVPKGYTRCDTDAHVAEVAHAVGFDAGAAGVGMLTAAEVGRVAVCDDEEGVRVEATVGLSLPVWAAAPADESTRTLHADAARAGTINVVAFVPVRHGDAALANLLCTVTEAKVQALSDGGVPGTGTASDAVTVLCPVEGAAEPFGGPRSVYGAPLARAVYAALRTGMGELGVITLVLGGARSGKSAVAEALAARHAAPVTYVATMDPTGDPELEARVEAHRRRRDASWDTVVVGDDDDLPEILTDLRGTVLVDSLGPWVARGAETRPPDLCAALTTRDGDTVLVSDEVGLAVHPSSVEGRHFRDALGALNLAVLAAADAVYLVVAGRALELPPVWPPA